MIKVSFPYNVNTARLVARRLRRRGYNIQRDDGADFLIVNDNVEPDVIEQELAQYIIDSGRKVRYVIDVLDDDGDDEFDHLFDFD